MKILFTSMPTSLSNESQYISMTTAPTTALYLLSSILIKEGYEVNILDPITIKEKNDYDSLKKLFKNSLCGVKIVCFSSNTINWALTKIAIEMIKNIDKKIIIILGGLHSTYFYDYIFKVTNIDYILLGDCEKTLPTLIKSIQNNLGYEKIDGLVYRTICSYIVNKNIPKVNENIYDVIPLPAFEYMPFKKYSILPIETSRGCKYSCLFCSIQNRRDLCLFKENTVIEKSKEIINKFQSRFLKNQIFITDDCFTNNLRRATNILEHLVNFKNSSYLIETRATDWLKKVDNYNIDVFKNNNVGRLAIGVECGYDEGLIKISKGLSIEILESTLKFYVKKNLIHKAFLSFIIGFPWETIDECLKTINYAASIVKRYGNGLVNVNWLRLYPSDLWFKRNEYGINLSENVFDDLKYEQNKYFLESHPKINQSSFRYIENVIHEYEDKGIYLRNS